MHAGLIGLSAAAIVSVYTVGYVHTSADEPPMLVAALETPAPAQTQPPVARATRSTGSTAPRATATPVTAATPTPIATTGSASVAYLDGTYTGVGTSRHGSIEATVVVKSGKIVSAEISSCQTKYPCSKVAGLPGQVVARQTATVNFVSGATDSSRAYAGAVSAALAKARA